MDRFTAQRLEKQFFHSYQPQSKNHYSPTINLLQLPLIPLPIRIIFINELALINKRGYALDEQENELGGRCVGAPIFDRTGYPIAAVSISVPIQRFPDKDIEKFGKKMISTAENHFQENGTF